MKKYLVAMSLAAAFVLCLAVDSSAQGRGRGGGGGNAGGHVGGGHGNGRGRPVDVDRSRGSRGNSDSGMRVGRNGGRPGDLPNDNELNRFRGISKKIGSTPAEMSARYQTELALNPDLKFGQFVAANVIADNLGRRNPNITSAAILAGLANGDSIGETLRNLRVPKEDAKRVQKDADRRIREFRDRD